LATEYDAIVRSGPNYVSLLKDKKFGLFDLVNNRLIKTMYERNIRQFNNNLLVAFKDRYYGFIDWDTQPVTEFEFEDVQAWNDSSAWVKRNFQWMILSIHSNKMGIDRVKDYRLIRDDDDEKLAIVHIENEFGVISNRKGLIIQPTFSDIVNVGTAEKPLYFTEKHVEEAGIYVVIYYDHKGLQVRRHIYEDSDYDRIYCHEN
jgi:hypothetical protein